MYDHDFNALGHIRTRCHIVSCGAGTCGRIVKTAAVVCIGIVRDPRSSRSLPSSHISIISVKHTHKASTASNMALSSANAEPSDAGIIEYTLCERDWWRERAVNRPVTESKAEDTEASYNSPFEKLPFEMREMVYSYLESKDLLTLSHVSWGFAIELNTDAAWQKRLGAQASMRGGHQILTRLSPRQRILFRARKLSVKICAYCVRSSLAPFATYDDSPGLSHVRGCKTCLPVRYNELMCVAEAKRVFRITNKDIKKDRWQNKKKRLRSTHYTVLTWYELALKLAEAAKPSVETEIDEKPDDSSLSHPDSGGDVIHNEDGSSFVDYDKFDRESEPQLVINMGEVTISL